MITIISCKVKNNWKVSTTSSNIMDRAIRAAIGCEGYIPRIITIRKTMTKLRVSVHPNRKFIVSDYAGKDDAYTKD